MTSIFSKSIFFQRIALNVIIFITLGIVSCTKSSEGESSISQSDKSKVTENVIVVIMDGARYSETWGDPTFSNIPNMGINLASESVVNTSFYNDGVTFTVPGHTAITTSNYQEISNNGSQLPDNASYLQYWIQQNQDSTRAWVISSKDKLQVLSNCEESDFKGKFMPANNCGVNGAGVGSGYRNDSLTYEVIKNVIADYHPRLMFINFKEPDVSGHSGNWENYLAGIKSIDEYVFDLWSTIQSDSVYKDKTALIVTNDHGRHLDNVADGFISHGDDCDGCRHIMFFAIGPDFKKGVMLNTPADQIDISVTIADLLKFDFPHGQGRVMSEIYD